MNAPVRRGYSWGVALDWFFPDCFIGRTRTGDGLLGDPVNLTLMGTGTQICQTMERANWVQADPTTARSSCCSR
jgi:hypothetical protein